ncbi:hypothetical protein [Psychroserpens damuponensis]|uniref:hypothetical protein n=1 Tax=Psychroserpens damuponensis TaxID=943936 RepID=UPI00058EAA68|nr:hypothetical protein [Psychroserpens damuponensis]
MNLKTELQRICENNNGVLVEKSYKVNGEAGSFVHIAKYQLKLEYRGFKMTIVYDFGNSDTAVCKLKSLNTNNIPEFKINTIDHLSKYILLKKQRWHVKCSDNDLKQNIEHLIIKLKLNDLIHNTAFDLNTHSKQHDDICLIQSQFSLKYKSKTESAESIVNFHKGLIDLVV